MPIDALENLNNIHMRINYSGDKAEIYNDICFRMMIITVMPPGQ